MIDFDRAALVLALLADDWDARWILADLFTESGETELAAYARDSRRVNREGDLYLAIQLLPVPEAIALACAMIERGMTGKGTVRRHAWLLARLARVRRLVRKGALPAEYVAEGGSLAHYRVTTSVREDAALEAAAQSLGAALEQAESPPAACAAVAAVASAMRRRARSGPELEWQVQRTRQMIEKLLAAAGGQFAAGHLATIAE
jgi:hypothetical protein